MSGSGWAYGRGRLALTAVVACVAGLCVTAGSASAILLHLPTGKEVSYAAMTRNADITPGAVRRAPSRFDTVLSNLDYSGGPVMTSNTNYVVVWTPSNYSGPAFLSDGIPAHGFVYGIDQYFQDLAHDSGGAQNSDSVAIQYNGPGGTAAAYNSHFGGEIDTSDPLPANGCSYAPAGGACLTDAQIQAELDHVLAVHGLPRDLAHEYFLITPPGIASCMDATGTQGCSANATGQTAFCAYHSASTTAASFLYAAIPDLDGLSGCDPFVSGYTCGVASTCEYENTFADGVLSAISHEHIESVTDPQPNNAWTDWQQCSSTSPMTCGGEIGDKCNGDQVDNPVASGTTYQYDATNHAYVPYNMTINSRKYWIQMEWSNQSASCQRTVPSLEPPPGSSFTYVRAPSQPNTIDFNAGASCPTGTCNIAHYVWQFNDFVAAGQPPQNITVETSSPTIAHTFPKAGVYTVALTTMTAGGRSYGSSQQAATVSPTVAAFSFSPGTPSEVTTVRFSGSATHDPLDSVSGYLWSFGDGSFASGATVSHRFHAGSHVVTLLVIDSLGQRSTVAHVVFVKRGCHVPNLKGKSLASARRALGSAGCSVGKVKRPRRTQSGKRLVVGGQSPGSGQLEPPGFGVNLRLVYK